MTAKKGDKDWKLLHSGPIGWTDQFDDMESDVADRSPIGHLVDVVLGVNEKEEDEEDAE